MRIDCNECVMQGSDACRDCVVSHVLAEPGPIDLDAERGAALDNLAAGGLVPRLRLIRRAVNE